MSAGRVLFLAGLAAWAGLGLRLLPFDASDLCYLLFLDSGAFGIQELVHPLFVPFLGLLKAVGSAAGFHGSLLMPLGVVNLTAACLALAALFLAVERVRGDAAAAAIAVVGFAFAAPGFWAACLRPTPYSLTVLCLASSCTTLLGAGPLRLAEGGGRLRCAGFLAGLACGFHLASAAFILPAAFIAAPHLPCKGRARAFGLDFLGPLGGALLGGFLILFLSHGLDPRAVFGGPLMGIVRGVEQVPLTSAWSNPRPWALVRDFCANLWAQAEPLAFLSVLAVVLKAAAGEARDCFTALRSDRAAAMAGVHFLAFAAFFIVNNTRNGLAFVCVLLLPFVLAALVPDRGPLRALFCGLWLAFLAAGSLAISRHESAPGRDPLLSESRFLSSVLGPDGMVLVPGCPFPEVPYLAKVKLVPISPPLAGNGPGLDPAFACFGASVPPLDPQALSALLRQGRRVFFAPGEPTDPLDPDVSGDFKKRQIFMPFYRSGSEQESVLQGLEPVLGRHSRAIVTSPQGRTYQELLPGELPRRKR